MSQSHIEAHVDLIANHEQEFLAKRTPGERLGDRIAAWVGSFTFVILHVCFFFVLWTFWNHLSSTTRQSDPYPFVGPTSHASLAHEDEIGEENALHRYDCAEQREQVCSTDQTRGPMPGLDVAERGFRDYVHAGLQIEVHDQKRAGRAHFPGKLLCKQKSKDGKD